MDIRSRNASADAVSRSGDDRLDRILIYTLGGAILAAFIPTGVKLANGPWRTEQEGHGPLILVIVAWLAWQCLPRLAAIKRAPAPVAGWAILLVGLAAMIVTRSQDVLMIEVGSLIPIVCGAILIAAGWEAMRVLAFPVFFLVFAVPPPGWMLDALTVPLKVMVSDAVTLFLYKLGYPIAQNGVMIMIGPYQLMVKDACAGMNSIMALSAIGVFYIHEFVSRSRLRAIVLFLSIVPITIAANFVRVLMLVLIAYYFGEEAVEGVFHDLTGFVLFAIALALFFALDGFLILTSKLLPKLSRGVGA